MKKKVKDAFGNDWYESEIWPGPAEQEGPVDSDGLILDAVLFLAASETVPSFYIDGLLAQLKERREAIMALKAEVALLRAGLNKINLN